jgi:hypothetical protein
MKLNIREWLDKATVLIQLNRWVKWVVVGLAVVAAGIWGVWAIRDGVEDGIEARIETAVLAERAATVERVKEELKKSEARTDKIVTDALNRRTQETLQLEASQKAVVAATADLRKVLEAYPDANERVSPATREMLRRSKARFND